MQNEIENLKGRLSAMRVLVLCAISEHEAPAAFFERSIRAGRQHQEALLASSVSDAFLEGIQEEVDELVESIGSAYLPMPTPDQNGGSNRSAGAASAPDSE
ncbi:hypothetical protein [Robbsia andropogonis]|uniref:hypothetical protein n=1 Tax=Robbsia andropogonis TaxID=28092 RepID=UPI00209CA57B|nr:hypothetical protein [Robbsia andropogonis]MCP1121554.1 hypothetical protein [Robbsia andropogonis]MCP1131360.1 hypothetical protein [Robbsia andropogonis]